ncbi:hypothetical protein Btru_024591 [Bulinus truncatus]|nr:hypothetical protein Btru_024591 [Bulinus truncatus]
MDKEYGYCYVQLFLTIISVLLCLAEFKSQQFQLMTDLYVNLRKIIVTYISLTQLECVLTCQSLDTCRAVAFDINTSRCSLGSALVVRPYARSETLQVMHVLDHPPCYQIPDFQIYEMGSVTTCAWTNESNETVNYTVATAACKARGAHLYTMKSVEKLSYPLTYGFTYWVGLDDIEVENVFRWADDRSILTNELRVQIFQPGQPNDYAEQDCCMLHGAGHQINDYHCNALTRYICEISDFS